MKKKREEKSKRIETCILIILIIALALYIFEFMYIILINIFDNNTIYDNYDPYFKNYGKNYTFQNDY